MFFLNLSVPELLALLGTLSSVVVALYLLDRLRKKHTVATLRFFSVMTKAPEMKHRRRLQQPWSLLLQLASLALLLLAIAQLRIGSPDRYSRDHVLILDSSAWMSARSGQGRLIDRARAAAKSYLKSIPSGDRVMLVRADALATPATFFESDRDKLRQAIDLTQPGAAPLNVGQAIEFAQTALRLHALRPGEIVFVGAGRVPGPESEPTTVPANLRVIAIPGPPENCGLRKVAVRRAAANPDTWDIFVTVKNYGAEARSVPLVVQFGGATVGSGRLDLRPGAEENVTFHYATRAGGWLEARLLSHDAFPLDDRALLELPPRESLPVAVYSDDAAPLKPVIASLPAAKVEYKPTASYDPAVKARIVILDRFAPSTPPKADSIWIQPPSGRSPIAVRSTAAKVKLTRWRSEDSLGSGLHTKDLELEQAEIFRLDDGDIAIAEAAAGPIIVGRPGKPKIVAFGFQPVLSAMRYELATPLLFANILQWMAPDIFRSLELTAETVGTVTVDLESEADPSAIHVFASDGRRLPFTLNGRELRFFSGAPGIVRVLMGGRELVYSLTLPQAGDIVWRPGGSRQGLPRFRELQPGARDIWQILALLAGLGLLAEWLLYGRATRRLAAGAGTPQRRNFWRKAS